MNRENLKNFKHNQEWIEGRFEYIEKYKASLTNITTILSDMPKGSRQVEDSMAEKIATLYDSIDDLLVRINEQNKKQGEILNQLEKVKQPYRLILEKAYIQGKSLVTVASEMNYTYEYMRKMNALALIKFDEIEKMSQNVTEKYTKM